MSLYRSFHHFNKDVDLQAKPVVFTNGCFDILHVGHVRYLQASKAYGKYLVVGLNSDYSVTKIKGSSRPLNSENDRAELLLALQCVDAVILFDESTPRKLIENLKPDILTKGGDYRNLEIVGKDIIESYGGQIKILPLEKGYSTTEFIEKIAKKN